MDVSKLAGVLTGTAFAIGVLYNIGYFTAIDLQLFPLLSYKDHLETLVFFVPVTVVPMLFCMWLRAHPERRRVADRTVIALAGGTVTAWVERDETAWSATFSGILMTVVFLTSFLVIAYCASIILENLLKPDEGRAEDQWRTIGFSGLGLLAFVTLFGNVRGHLDSARSRFDTDISLTGEGHAGPDTRPARIVRAIDGGLLLIFKDTPDRLAYIRYETVRSIAESLHP